MPELELGKEQCLYYQDPHPEGSPTVLLLHGLGATGESWGLQIPALIEEDFRVIAPDARGFGKSGFPGGSNSVKRMAEDIVDLLNAIQIQSCHVVGISMGGTLALQIAIDHPKVVSKLVLVNTFARLRPKQPGQWWYHLLRFLLVHFRDMDSQARLVADHLFPKPEQDALRNVLIDQIREANPRAYRSAVRSLALFDVQRSLGAIIAPTLVVSGKNDDTVPLATQRELVEGIPTARHVVIQDSGHAVIAEQPACLNKILIEFLIDS